MRCELGAKLLSTTYETPLGAKRVKWWEMRPLPEEGDDPGAVDPTEISEVLWLPFDTAWHKVTYGTDREVLSALASKVLGYLVNRLSDVRALFTLRSPRGQSPRHSECLACAVSVGLPAAEHR